jgi:hypothetical protein
MTNAGNVIALALFAMVLSACEAEKPDRLELMPSGPYVFDKKGQSEDVQVTAYVGKKPYTSPIKPSFASSDENVATVDDKGHVTCTGSGTATITATAEGASGSGEVRAQVVGSMEVAKDAPERMRLNHKGHQLTVVVKDTSGKVIEKPKVQYRATDYCVEVDDSGLVKPLSEGECDVVVSVADQYQRVKFSVRD